VRVSSPIGELPFEPRTLRIHNRGIEVNGVMGAWPAQVTITAEDLPAVTRMSARPALIAAAGLATVLGLIRLVRPNRRRHRHRERNDG